MTRRETQIKDATFLVERIANALEHRRVKECFTDNRVDVPTEIAKRCDSVMEDLADALEWYVEARIKEHERDNRL